MIQLAEDGPRIPNHPVCLKGAAEMLSVRSRAAVVALSLMGGACGGIGLSPARAQAATLPEAGAGWTPLVEALQMTVKTGRPAVVLVTSQTDAGSPMLRSSLPAALTGGSALLAEMAAESYPTHVQKLGLASLPAVLVYVRDGAGVKLAGMKDGAADPRQTTAWLGTFGLVQLSAPAPVDEGIVQAQYATGQGSYPSGQNVPPLPQPPSPSPPPQYYMPAPVQAVVPAPAPVVVPAPTAPVVFQPQPTQIVVAPAPPPSITFASAPAAAPTVYSAPASAPPNLFAPPAAAPPAAAPPAAAPVAMAPVAYAPQPVAAAPAVGQGPITTAVLTTIAPSLAESLIGALGEHLRRKRLPRLETAQAPVAQAPVAQAPVAQAPAGYAPAGYVPAGYAPQAYMLAAPAPAAEAPPAYVPVPSPQGGPVHHHQAAPHKWGLFHRGR